MAVQLEGVIDVLEVVYPEMDIVFTLDHSSGHARKQDNGLYVGAMNRDFGGAQPAMHDTVVPEVGPFSPKVQTGEVQSMVFKEGDAGPFWMKPAEQEKRKHDQATNRTRKKNKTKAELLHSLFPAGRAPKEMAKLRVKKLQEMATAQGISTEVETAVVVEGWMGKPKGIRQVLYERGYLDPDRLSEYRLCHDDEELSYSSLLAACSDFANEKSRLQQLAEDLGTTLV